MKPQTLKGFRDFLPVMAKKRQFVIQTLRSVFESYGFEPLETPTLEYEEILTGKYGDEGDKLMYRFEDNGGRRVALRYDQTVPLARVIAEYQNEISLPFKRYQIQSVFRADKPQKGRYREFLQCDIDTIGSDKNSADAEIIAIATNAFEKLGFKNFKILLNDRSTFSNIPQRAITIIDKLKKIGAENVKIELEKAGFDPQILDKIQNTLPSESLDLTIKVATRMGIDREKLQFSPTLARGLDYYTGTIIEVESPDYPAGSLGGGGRYDNLIGMFSNQDFPAVGFSFGFDRIIEAMTELNLFPDDLNKTKVLVTIFDLEHADKSAEIASFLRAENINTELWLNPETKMEKQLKYADKKAIPFVLVLGPKEVEKNVLMLKNMNTREQEEASIEEIIDKIKN